MNPFDHFSKEELKKANTLGSLACNLKKRRDEGFVSMFSSTMDRYFRFFCHGRYIAYFNSKPKFDTEPKNIILIDEIDKIEREEKLTDFMIFLKDGKTIKLKHDDESVVASWVKSIKELKLFYKSFSQFSEEAMRKYKDKLDPRTMFAILEELESRVL